jgi:hypothetical protein
MSRLAFRLVLSFSVCVSALAFADSHVRIVRLSYIEGTVHIDRGTGQFEKAMVNLPVAEGTRLETGNDGRAEIEFEDGSTIRLVSNSKMQFPQLSLSDSGAKLSTAELSAGTAYLNYLSPKDNEFTLRFSRQSLRLARTARLRVRLSGDAAAVAVFKGEVDVQGEHANGVTLLKKGQTASYDPANNTAPLLAKGIDPEPFDNWDKQQSEFHDRYAGNSYNSYSPYRYGTADLSYYGSFFNAPGYGTLWQPYLVGAGWDPFMDGAWAFYPGSGFGWVSAYPWGWTPYHYGTWLFLPGYGWAWQPGGTWMPMYAQPRVANAPKGFVAPQAPAGGRSLVVVNHGPVPVFSGAAGNKVVIRNNSAGLGVPRGEINHLGRVSQEVQQRGTVTERAHPAPMTQRPEWSNSGGMERESSSRRGSAPAHSAPPPPPSMSPAPSSSSAPSGGRHK